MNAHWFALEWAWGPPGRPLPTINVVQMVGGPVDGDLTQRKHYVWKVLEAPVRPVEFVRDGQVPALVDMPRERTYTLKKWRWHCMAAPVPLYVCDGVDLEARKGSR